MPTGSKNRWNFRPDLNARLAPYYQWPPAIKPTLAYLASAWSLLDVRIYVLLFSVLSWHWLSPSLTECVDISRVCITQIWLRNFLTLLVVAGGLHLYFYTFRRQSPAVKYDARHLDTDSKRFHFNKQVWDNMFWVLTGTVTILTFYESIMMWAYANKMNEVIKVNENPILFCALLFFTPAWTSFHFYWQHRAFHLPGLYKLGHHWHHKNVNVGPWSGAAVHPIENIVWFSAVLILILLPSHPIHAIFLLQLQVITAITTHVGYDSLVVGDRLKFRLGDFYHQLHHRFFDCNYGTSSAPWDRWFKTYHDGSAESDAWVRRRQASLRKK